MAIIKIEGLTNKQATVLCNMFAEGELLNIINAEISEQYPMSSAIGEAVVRYGDNPTNPTHVVTCIGVTEDNREITNVDFEEN